MLPDGGCLSVRHFRERRQKFESLAQFTPVYRCPRNTVVVCDHPADLMLLAVAPQQPADLPDIVLRATTGAAMDLAFLLYGKLNDIVGLCRHSPDKVIK